FDADGAPTGALRESAQGDVTFFDADGAPTGALRGSAQGDVTFFDADGAPTGALRGGALGLPGRQPARRAAAASPRPWAHPGAPPGALRGSAQGDVTFFDADGAPTGARRGVALGLPGRQLARRAAAASLGQWAYTVEWEAIDAPGPAAPGPGIWLLLADRGGA